MGQNETKLLRGVLPYLIMRCAEVQAFRGFHGYALINLMRNKFGVYLGPSTIYPLLRQLENEGLLISHWEIPLINGVQRSRKVYIITDDGLAAVTALTSTMHLVAGFAGQMPQERRKPERNNVITL